MAPAEVLVGPRFAGARCLRGEPRPGQPRVRGHSPSGWRQRLINRLAQRFAPERKLGNFSAMDGERLESAVQRIEAALARIAEAADKARPAPKSVSSLVDKHETLRETVAATLKELDELIGKLEK